MTKEEFNYLMKIKNMLKDFLEYSRANNMLSTPSHLTIRREIAMVDHKLDEAQKDGVVI